MANMKNSVLVCLVIISLFVTQTPVSVIIPNQFLITLLISSFINHHHISSQALKSNFCLNLPQLLSRLHLNLRQLQQPQRLRLPRPQQRLQPHQRPRPPQRLQQLRLLQLQSDRHFFRNVAAKEQKAIGLTNR
jgi:hypothetical protein